MWAPASENYKKSLPLLPLFLLLWSSVIIIPAEPFTIPTTTTPPTTSLLKVAVTGANGFVASELVKQLLERGEYEFG